MSRSSSELATKDEVLPDGYPELLERLKSEIQTARVRAALKVTQELIELYLRLGTQILVREQQEGWGSKVIDRLAKDLRNEFPDMKGFSRSNLKYMRAFAEAWVEDEIGQRLIGQLPWGHNITLLKLKDPADRRWYAAMAAENAWSRNVLELQIATGLKDRKAAALTNFNSTLPAPQSDLAHELIKDPYNFEFLGISDKAAEREVHHGLIEHIRSFLLELGAGFAFIGSEYHLEIDGRDFYMDLLFYHVKLHCYVVVELKSGQFEPEYAGKMNFYLSAVDDIVRDSKTDEPTIGILLCRSKSGLIAEYALRDTKKPMGISTYLTEDLPKKLQASLPSTHALHAELESDDFTSD